MCSRLHILNFKKLGSIKFRLGLDAEGRRVGRAMCACAHVRVCEGRGCEHMIGMWVCVGSRVIRFRYYDVGVMCCGACSNVGISISRRVGISPGGV